ncbi:hypothetical protein BGZ73_001932, partial [Actinomortierella ambigua]
MDDPRFLMTFIANNTSLTDGPPADPTAWHVQRFNMRSGAMSTNSLSTNAPNNRGNNSLMFQPNGSHGNTQRVGGINNTRAPMKGNRNRRNGPQFRGSRFSPTSREQHQGLPPATPVFQQYNGTSPATRPVLQQPCTRKGCPMNHHEASKCFAVLNPAKYKEIQQKRQSKVQRLAQTLMAMRPQLAQALSAQMEGGDPSHANYALQANLASWQQAQANAAPAAM